MKLSNRSIFSSLLVVILLFSSIASAATAGLPKKIGITYVKSPLNVPSIIQKENNLFQDEFPGVSLTFPELNAGPRQTAAMAAGEVQFANCLGATSAILAVSEGLPLKIIGVYSRAPKAFVIVVRNSAIKTVADLKGRSIGGPKGTILHQLLVAALKRSKIRPTEVNFINMDIPSAAAALQKGSIQAALLAGPAAYNATENGGIVLADGEGLVDATTVIATTEEFAKKYPITIGKFLNAHHRALEFMKQKPQEAMRIAGEATGLSPKAVATMYPWYDFDPTIRKSDVAELNRTQDFMMEFGLQRTRINIDDLFIR